MYGNNSAGVGVGGSYFVVPFTCVQLLSVYCVVISVHSTLHEAVSGEVICKPIYPLQH